MEHKKIKLVELGDKKNKDYKEDEVNHTVMDNK